MQTELKINGMSCAACVAHVEKSLEAVSGVRRVEVELQPGRALVQHEGADVEELKRAVAAAGYEAT